MTAAQHDRLHVGFTSINNRQAFAVQAVMGFWSGVGGCMCASPVVTISAGVAQPVYTAADCAVLPRYMARRITICMSWYNQQNHQASRHARMHLHILCAHPPATATLPIATNLPSGDLVMLYARNLGLVNASSTASE